MQPSPTVLQRSPSTNPMIRHLAAVVITVATLAACDDAAGTSELTCPAADVPLCVKADSVLAIVNPMVTDAASRSGGALANAAVKATLIQELDAVSQALAAGRVTQALAAVERARAAVTAARNANNPPGDAPDLTAIELALIQLARALT